MKHLIPVFLLLIIGCGGGSTADNSLSINEQPEVQEVVEKEKQYMIRVTNDTVSQEFIGHGIKRNGIINTHPRSLSNSDYVVSGYIDGDDVRLYSYFTRKLVLSFTEGDSSGYHLFIDELDVYENNTLEDLSGSWNSLDRSELGGVSILSLVYQDGLIEGSDTTGCSIIGEVFIDNGAIMVDLTLDNCETAGEYQGSILLNEQKNKIYLTAFSQDHGITTDFLLTE